MSISRSLLPEFDQEMRATRSMIALVTDDLAGWRPHEKSWTTGELALHLANLPMWAKIAIEGTAFDVNPEDGSRTSSPTWESAAATLAHFDAQSAAAREAIDSATDADLMIGWSLQTGGQTVFTLPRIAVLRTFVMSHMIHHRGQLSVYLRMKDVPLPEIYGPNADSKT